MTSLGKAALRRRLAKGAEAIIEPVGWEDEQSLKELLGKYINALDAHEPQAGGGGGAAVVE